MSIPAFPEFSPLALEHRVALEAYLDAHPPQCSEYTFTNLFAWRGATQCAVARYGDGYLLRKTGDHGLAFFEPLVPGDGTAALRDAAAYLRGHGAAPRLERVGEAFLARTDTTDFTVTEDRDNFDYVYRVDELVALAGEKFHDKKNLLNQFTKRYTYTYRDLTPELAGLGLIFGHQWCEERECAKHPGLVQEQCAVFQMLTHLDALRTTGGVIEVDGKMVALTLGEALNPDTLVIHIEKARNGFPGLYQAINWEYLRHAGADFVYVNREQDLGIPGLRKAKTSYNPVHLVKKFVVTG
jgi:hypothetical protein